MTLYCRVFYNRQRAKKEEDKKLVNILTHILQTPERAKGNTIPITRPGAEPFCSWVLVIEFIGAIREHTEMPTERPQKVFVSV